MDQKPPLFVPVICNYNKMTYMANGEELPKDKTNLMIYTLKRGEPLVKGEFFQDSDIKDYRRHNDKIKFFVDMRTVRELTEEEEKLAVRRQQHQRVMESVKNMKKRSSRKRSLSNGGKKSRRRTNRKSNKKRRNKSKRL